MSEKMYNIHIILCTRERKSVHTSYQQILTFQLRKIVSNDGFFFLSELASSDPNLIGDCSKPYILPLKLGRNPDLKTIECHTLAKLMRGEYKNAVSSYSIIDCR